MSKICFVRVDRIGDLILTLPAESAWLSYRPNDSALWVFSKNWKVVGDYAASVSEKVLVNDVSGFFEKFRQAFSMKKALIEHKIDVAIFFHSPWWIAFAFFLARVPTRVGPASQWFSWLFFNKKLRQKRSLSVKHELDYNLDLVHFALDLPLSRSLEKKGVTLNTPPESVLAPWREKLLRAPGPARSELVVLHPGMAGSARNWPAEKYFSLAQKLVEQNFRVVVTGSATDLSFVDETNILKINGVINLVGKTNLTELLAVLSLAKTVIAPSTGVAHLAASLGKHVVAIYSPVLVQAPKRWRPLSPSNHTGRGVDVFVPKVECPGKFSCLGEACSLYDCMKQIEVDSVLACVIQKS